MPRSAVRSPATPCQGSRYVVLSVAISGQCCDKYPLAVGAERSDHPEQLGPPPQPRPRPGLRHRGPRTRRREFVITCHMFTGSYISETVFIALFD